jgi:ubiquinone/menaquinone biosynthesis C-methylase UbiE
MRAHHAPMRRLVDVPEHLDGDLADTATLGGNLRDLRRINRLLGGTALSVEAVRRLVAARPAVLDDPGGLRVLDVGTGAADIPMALLRVKGTWPRATVIAVDSRREVLDAAVRLEPRLATQPGLTLEVADGRALPYPDGAFHVAHASMVLHHLDRLDAVALLRELARVARLGVVVNDLDRNRRSLAGAWLVLHALTRNAWTLHDGVLSARRAWTHAEAVGLLAEAGLRPLGTAHGMAGHRWAIAAVPS